MTKQYVTCCVHSTAEKIIAMTERATQITYRTARRRIGKSELQRVFPYYEWEGRKGGLPMCRDWMVHYYRSVYDGQPCYYVEHSRIEYIFA